MNNECTDAERKLIEALREVVAASENRFSERLRAAWDLAHADKTVDQDAGLAVDPHG